jgi:hypothetical protein
MGVNTQLNAIDFYEKCVDGKFSENDFALKADGTSVQKSKVSTELMGIHRCAKMYGESGLFYTEKLLGNVRCCIVFIRLALFIPLNAIPASIISV